MRNSMDMLIREARKTGASRGHSLKPAVLTYHPNTKEEVYAVITCRSCGMQVTVKDKPCPNEIKIGGELVSMNCPQSDVKEWFSTPPKENGFYMLVLLDEENLYPDVVQTVDVFVNRNSGHIRVRGTLDGDMDLSTIDYALWHGPIPVPDIPILESIEKLFSHRRANRT